MLEGESPVRVVIDTNVWISGLLWKGLPWHVLISGNKHLLAIEQWQGIPIVTPHEFLE